MRCNVRKLALAAALFLAMVLVSGCIVIPVWWDHNDRAPRAAIIHVHVYDYYTYAPVSWAVVELYEESWWTWDYRGSWHVNYSGYTTLNGGYLYDDHDGGPDERDFGIEVYADGYYPEWFELELDYWDSTETISFYLLPWADCGDCWTPLEGEPQETPEEWKLPKDRVRLGEPSESEVETEQDATKTD
jgi:hypothetical protein